MFCHQLTDQLMQTERQIFNHDGWLSIALGRGVSIKQLAEWPAIYDSSHPKVRTNIEIEP